MRSHAGRDESAVRHGTNGGGGRAVEPFETSGGHAEKGDSVSVNTGGTGGTAEAVWNGEAVDECPPGV